MRRQIEKVCAYPRCGKPFKAARTSARYDAPQCRARHCHERKDLRRALRPEVLDRDKRCLDCGGTQSLIVVFGDDVSMESGRTLCRRCLSKR